MAKHATCVDGVTTLVSMCGDTSCAHVSRVWRVRVAESGAVGATASGTVTLDAKLTMVCAACGAVCCVFERYAAELVPGKTNLLIDGLAAAPGTTLLVDAAGHAPCDLDVAEKVDFEWRARDGRGFTLRVGCSLEAGPGLNCGWGAEEPPASWQADAVETLVTSRLRGQIEAVLGGAPELHHDTARKLTWAEADAECGRVRELCRELWVEDAALRREEAWVADALVDLDLVRSCRFMAPLRAASVGRVGTALGAELARLEECRVVVPGAAERFAVVCDEYRRLQQRVSWEDVRTEDTNRADLVNVRACYVALRAIEDHLAAAFSATPLVGARYYERSHAYQLEQMYANNAGNSLKLSDAVYADVRRVLALVVGADSVGGAREMAVVRDVEPLVHRWQVAMCVRGLVGNARAKNVAWRVPRTPVAGMLPGRERAVQDLLDMAHVDCSHRLITSDVRWRFTVAVLAFAHGQGSAELEAVSALLAPARRGLVAAVLGTQAPGTHAFLASEGCTGFDGERVAACTLVALRRRYRKQ